MALDKKLHQKATIAGFRWNIINQIASQATTFLIGIILMNLLEPEEFGLIAMATVFSGLLELFSKFGLGASLIQSPKIGDKDIDTVFWSSAVIGVILAISMIGLSWPIAMMYKEPDLVSIIQVLSLSFLFLPVATTPSSLLQKDLRFKEIFYVNIIAVIFSSILAIILAYQGFGVWSLVYHRLSATFVRSIGMWIIAKFKPGFLFSKEHLRKHLKFGLPFLGSKTFIYLIGTADNFIIGYFLGSRQLGLYSRAYALSSIPARRLGLMLSTVLFPSFAQLRNDKEHLVRMFKKLNDTLLFFVSPLMLILSLGAEPIILIISNEEWLPSAYLLEYLSFVAITKVSAQVFHNLLISQGKSDLDFKINSITGLGLVTVFIVGSLISIEFFVQLYLVMSIVVLFVWYILIAQYFKVTFWNFSKGMIRYAVIIFSIYVGWKLILSSFTIDNNWLELGIVVFYVGIFWIAASFIFQRANLINYFKLILKLIRN